MKFSMVFLSCEVNGKRSVHSSRYHLIITLSLADRHDTRDKWHLARNPYRNWLLPHTNIKIFFSYPMTPWATGLWKFECGRSRTTGWHCLTSCARGELSENAIAHNVVARKPSLLVGDQYPDVLGIIRFSVGLTVETVSLLIPGVPIAHMIQCQCNS